MSGNFPRGNLPIRGPRGDRGGGRGDRGSHGGERGGHGGDRGGRGDRGGPRGGPSGPNPLFLNVPVPSAEVASFEDKCIASNKGKQASQGELALRPDYGTKGRAIVLRANFFEMMFKPGILFYSHTVICKPEPTPKRHRDEIFARLMRHPKIIGAGSATDKAQELVASQNLEDISPITISVNNDHGEMKEYKITLTLSVTINPQTLLQTFRNTNVKTKAPEEDNAVRMMNILMSGYPSKDQGVVIKGATRNKVFWIDTRKQVCDLKGGLECLRGFYSSVRPTAGRMLLNLNVSHGTFFRPGPLCNLVREFEEVFKQDRPIFHRYIKFLRVEVTHLPSREEDGKTVRRRKTIWGCATPDDAKHSPHPSKVPRVGSCANNVQFFEEERDKSGNPTGRGDYISVAAYFKKTYNMVLKFADKPVVNVGSTAKPVYLPLDVCIIPPGQMYKGELHLTQRQNIIRFSCRRPPQNYESIINDGLKIMGLRGDEASGVGIKTQKDMIAVPGRILSAPSLKYATKKENPKFGAWNLVGKKFCEGANIRAWTGLLVKRNDRPDPGDPSTALRNFYTKSQALGLKLPPPTIPPIVIEIDMKTRNWMLVLDRIFRENQNKYHMLIVMLPMGVERVFDHIKWIGDVKSGLLTHCCLAEKFITGNEQYLANNAMKVNLKMGGVNQTLDSPHRVLAGGKTMVVGLDVTHPSPTDPPSFPSLASIVASTDSRLGQWPGQIRVQGSRVEKIEHLKQMMLGRLQRWQKDNKGNLPQNILIYRDGVSEGQYQMVLQEELKLVRDATQAIYKTNQPNISVIVVTKRHNVRFFPTQDADQDRTSNPHAGTVVDRGVTRPIHWDFFLQAQSPLQGSARPAHYTVIHDEIFTAPGADPKPADSLQELTHHICYMMGRCTRSISYSTPAFLADKFCDRARKYVRAYYYEKADFLNPSAPGDDVVALAANARESMVYI